MAATCSGRCRSADCCAVCPLPLQDSAARALVVRSTLHDTFGSDGAANEVPFQCGRLAVPVAFAGSWAARCCRCAADRAGPSCPAGAPRRLQMDHSWEAGGEALHEFLEDGLAKHLKVQARRGSGAVAAERRAGQARAAAVPLKCCPCCLAWQVDLEPEAATLYGPDPT